MNKCLYLVLLQFLRKLTWFLSFCCTHVFVNNKNTHHMTKHQTWHKMLTFRFPYCKKQLRALATLISFCSTRTWLHRRGLFCQGVLQAQNCQLLNKYILIINKEVLKVLKLTFVNSIITNKNISRAQISMHPISLLHILHTIGYLPRHMYYFF